MADEIKTTDEIVKANTQVNGEDPNKVQGDVEKLK